MAKNLRAKLPPNDTLYIYDKNKEATSKFLQEVGIAAGSAGAGERGMNIEIAACVRDVAEKSVRAAAPKWFLCLPHEHPTS